MNAKDEQAIHKIETQLRAGYLDLIDTKQSREMHIIREAIKEWKENHK